MPARRAPDREGPARPLEATTFVADLRRNAITTPFVVDRAMNGAIFLAYVEQCLIPTLRLGDIVVMDNLAARECVNYF